MERELSEEEKFEMWKENLRRENAIRRQLAAMVEDCLADPTGLTKDLDPTEPLVYSYTRADLVRDIINMRSRGYLIQDAEFEESE